MTQRRTSERGNVFVVLIAAIGLAGILGVATYNLMSGPYSSLARISGINMTKQDMMAASKIAIMHAINNASGGDCDADGFVEPPQWRTGAAGAFPSGGGLFPNNINAPIIKDAWDTDFGYCAWDVATYNAVGCGDVAGNYLDGTPDPTTGVTVSQTVIAMISAGPDRKFQSSCVAYNAGTPDALLVNANDSDDIIIPLTYAEAANATSSLWKMKTGDPDTIFIDKNIEVGSASISTAGLGSFLAFNAGGQVTTTGTTVLGDAPTANCIGGNEGLIKYNPDVGSGDAGIDFCDGTDWVTVGSGGGGGGGGGLWELTTDTIHPITTSHSVSIGSDTLLRVNGAGVAWSMTSDTGKDMLISQNEECGDGCQPSLSLLRARNTLGAPAVAESGDLLGRIIFGAQVGSSIKTTARIDTVATGVPGANSTLANIDFYTMDNAGALNRVMRIMSDGYTGLGTAAPTELLHLTGNTTRLQINSHNSSADEGAVFAASASRSSNATLEVGDTIHRINFVGRDTNSYETLARITSSVAAKDALWNSISQDTIFSIGRNTSDLKPMLWIRGAIPIIGQTTSPKVGVGRTTAPEVTFDINGVFMSDNSAGTNNDFTSRAPTGAGKRFMFDAQFFCCEVTDNRWNGPSGYTTSLANWGTNNDMAEIYGLGIGYNNQSAGGYAHTLIGTSNGADGYMSTAVGYTNAVYSPNTTDNSPIAIGSNNTVSDSWRMCIGNNLTCGAYATRFGLGLGSYATATTNNGSSVIGLASSAAGAFTNTTANSLRIGGGNWGIGTVTPSYSLHVVGDAGNNLSANWTNVSDARLKDIDGPYKKGLADIMRLEPVRFHYKKDNPLGLPSDIQQYGFIAQDVRKSFPEAVSKRDDGYLDFDMHPITIAMIPAVKEIKVKNENIAKTNAEWRTRNQRAEDAVIRLEEKVAELKKTPRREASLSTRPALMIPVLGILLAGGLWMRRRKDAQP